MTGGLATEDEMKKAIRKLDDTEFKNPSGGGVSRRTEFRVLISGLPTSASWQDLKDHMRYAGDVTFAQVFRDSRGTQGTVDYATEDEMKKAIRKLDDTEFKNPFDRSYIRVKEDTRESGGGGGGARAQPQPQETPPQAELQPKPITEQKPFAQTAGAVGVQQVQEPLLQLPVALQVQVQVALQKPEQGKQPKSFS
eukprot:CAMPEP_0198232302 /NCGR_PEP_ID=MMETSP1445-20131203/115658_1 /TAXON_ID=36898 /ORGANISM="Pyramimonas sp., Strain CCMP2087" /LENGTH=194 /DNA_ID=CAMNT_0043912967 /DNA_START=298 /DNA_END=883 /DNA_ORIENTATION=-